MRSFSEFFWVKMALSALIGCMIGLFPLFLDAIISIFRKKKNDFAHGADGPFKEYPPFLTQYESIGVQGVQTRLKRNFRFESK